MIEPFSSVIAFIRLLKEFFPNKKTRKVIAADFVYSFNRLFDPKVSSAMSLLDNVEKTKGFEAPTAIRADQFFINGVRLPYFKFPRNPTD